MSKKQGEMLKRAVSLSDYSSTDLANKLNISRGQLYILYKQAVIPENYLQKLEALGILLSPESQPDKTSSDSSTKDSSHEMYELLMRVKVLEEKINDKEKIIALQDNMLAVLTEKLKAFETIKPDKKSVKSSV